MSAHTGEGCDRLLAAIETALGERDEEIVVRLPHERRANTGLAVPQRPCTEGDAKTKRGFASSRALSPKAAGRLRRMLSITAC